MSTNNRWQKLAVKSDPRETRLKSRSKDLTKAGNEVADSGVQQAGGRGRPRLEDKGQLVSCRLPAEELHAFDALCTQLSAKSRSDGVRSVVRMASGFLEFSREDSAKLEDIRYELGKIGTNVNQIALAANRGRAPMVKAQRASVDDARGAQLLQMLPQTKLYATGLEGDRLTQGKETVDLSAGVADRLKKDIVSKAVALGLSGDRMTERLEAGAANAWEERDWVRSDLLALSGRRRADLCNPDQSWKVVDDLEGFYDAAAKLIRHTREHDVAPQNDRLLRALGSMGRIMQADGKVEFRGDAHAERFADELRQRYGKGIVAELARGRTDALAGDFKDAHQRKWIARAVVSAAKSHVAFGLTLSEACKAENSLKGMFEQPEGQQWEAD